MILNLTTLNGSKDQTVIIGKHEHPFVRWDTCVNYALADIPNVSKLQLYIDRGEAVM